MGQFINIFSLKGKKAIVTGGSRGLCNCMADALHDAGAEVILIGKSDKVYSAAEKMSTPKRKVYAVQGDLSDFDHIDDIFNKCMDIFDGHLDILLNGAGIQYRCRAIDFPREKWQDILNLNLTASFYMAQLAGKVMLEQKYGKIINIASMTSFFGSVLIPAYTASKGGVAQMTKALANEWASSNINVNAIAPGYMATKMTEDMKTKNPSQYAEITGRIPAGRWGNGDDLRGIAVFLASDASAYINGAVIPVDGGYLSK